jgi:hypothetical protein
MWSRLIRGSFAASSAITSNMDGVVTRTLFKDGLIFDGRGPNLIADQSILVEDGVINTVSATVLC